MNAGDEFEMMRSPRLAIRLEEKREVVVHDIMQLSPSEVDIAAVRDLSSTIQAHIQDLKNRVFQVNFLLKNSLRLDSRTHQLCSLLSGLVCIHADNLWRQRLLLRPPWRLSGHL